MNHPSQFAQPFSWGIAAKAADAGPLLLASAAIIHDQMYDDRRAGQPVGECSRHAPVRVNLFRGQGAFMHTGRGSGLGTFSADGRGCSPAIAINIKSTRRGHFECVSQRLPSHVLNSRLYGHNRRAGDIGLCPTPPRRSQKCLN